MLKQLVNNIIDGYRLTEKDDLSFLLSENLDDLKIYANTIRKSICGNHINLCSIINGRSGKCPENCKFCAQSSHNTTNINKFDFLNKDYILSECKKAESNGVHRFSIVTAGRNLSDSEFELAIEAYKLMKKNCPDISICASHGLLTESQFIKLRNVGVKTYHANIETSKRYFPKICTTHTFEDKIKCIKLAQKAGLNVCSGGIIGLGETWQDRIDMALILSKLNIKSIPINALIPIKGTPLENNSLLNENDIIRTVVIFRFINPTAYIRLAAGRNLLNECGKEAFFSGANAAITGDMLTTSGNSVSQDKDIFIKYGFDISPEN